MNLEKITKATERKDEISNMASFVCKVLGFYRMEVNEHSQDYTEFSSYKTRTFDISNDSDRRGPEIKYKGKLVFRVTRKRHYYKPGDWEEQFERLYSRAINEQERWV